MSEAIVVAVDHHEAHRGLIDLGIRMVRLLDETLVLASVVVGPADANRSPLIDPATEADDPQRQRARRKQELDVLAGQVPGDILCTTAVVAAPSVESGMEMLAADFGAGVVVLGASHRGIVDRFLDGDPARGLARHAPCAVLLAPEDDDARDASGAATLDSIGIAWDRSPAAAEALAVAAALAARVGCTLRLVHVLESEVALFVPPADPPIGRELEHRRRTEAEADMTRAIDALGPGLAFECDIHDGHRAPQLQAVSAELDLLVVGSRRIGPAHRLVERSLSDQLLHRMHCPLLVIPHGARFPAVPHTRL